MFKYHPQRGSLEEAMKETVELADFAALRAHIAETWPEALLGTVVVKPYGYDARIGWDTHLVCVNGNAMGYTDGPVVESL